MPTEATMVKRASWVVAIRGALKDFTFTEETDDTSTVFHVGHSSAPAWKTEIAIRTSERGAFGSWIEIDSRLWSYSLSSAMLEKLVARMLESCSKHYFLSRASRTSEANAGRWIRRQENELEGLKPLPSISAEIIKMGPFTGMYRVSFDAGHPLENLTLEEYKALHAFVSELRKL